MQLFRMKVKMPGQAIPVLLMVMLMTGMRPMAQANQKDWPKGALADDPRWFHPRFVNNRPGHQQKVLVNPPRFSWGYEPAVRVPGRLREVPVRMFRFQIAKNKSFSRPVVDVKTPINFYNALEPLSPGTWYWRVYYGKDGWSDVRAFEITRDLPEWDRSKILDAEKILKRKSRPLMGPSRGQWKAWHEELQKKDGHTRWGLSRLKGWADQAIEKEWYKKGLPKSDKRTGQEKDRGELLRFETMAREMAYVALAYKLTGDKKYAGVEKRLLELAAYPKGGLSSPEGHGSGIKFTSRIAKYMALCYDWLYSDLSRSERKRLQDAIYWRVSVQMKDFPNWASENGTQMLRMGISIDVGSHPYQNYMWNLPAVLIMAKDDKRMIPILEMKLSYLMGVSGGAGWDEAWNEGQHYGLEKAGTMLEAMLYVQYLLPELELAKNPFLEGYGRWMRHLLPLGISHLPFGDVGGGDLTNFDYGVANGSTENAYRLALLTGNGVYTWRNRQGVDFMVNGIKKRRGYTPLIREPWHMFITKSTMKLPEPVEKEEKQALFHESGWVMVNSERPSDWKSYNKAVGMLFQARPRGGYSHSYKSDGTFVWHAYGQVLTAGGGTMMKMNPHTVESIAHNVMMVNGQGQRYNLWAMQEPYIARIIGFHQGKNYTHWVADMTNAYHADADLKRWLRHVVFVDEKWFVIYDDLESKTKPARFSWRFQVTPKVNLKMNAKAGRFDYDVNGVKASVVFATPAASIEMRNLRGREGFKNPISGKDHYQSILERMGGFAKNARTRFFDTSVEAIKKWTPEHNLWVTNRKPARKFNFMTALVASPSGRAEAQIKVLGDKIIQVKPVGSSQLQTVSFDPKKPAKGALGITIDPEAWAKFSGR